MELIENFILESYPYIDNIDVIFENKNEIDFLILLNQEYYNNNINKLIQKLALLGSYNIAKQLKLKEKIVCLGTYLVLNKVNFNDILNDNSSLICKTTAIFKNSKKAQIKIEIYSNSVHLYSMQLEYIILTQNIFNKKFESFKTNNSIEKLNKQEIITKHISEYEFNININFFCLEDCLGHFEHYPIVPAVKIVEMIEFYYKKLIPQNNITQIKQVNIFANIPIPINIPIKIIIKIIQLNKFSKQLICNVLCDNNIEYGTFLFIINNY